jgi:hypothetical protein
MKMSTKILVFEAEMVHAVSSLLALRVDRRLSSASAKFFEFGSDPVAWAFEANSLGQRNYQGATTYISSPSDNVTVKSLPIFPRMTHRLTI